MYLPCLRRDLFAFETTRARYYIIYHAFSRIHYRAAILLRSNSVKSNTYRSENWARNTISENKYANATSWPVRINFDSRAIDALWKKYTRRERKEEKERDEEKERETESQWKIKDSDKLRVKIEEIIMCIMRVCVVFSIWTERVCSRSSICRHIRN